MKIYTSTEEGVFIEHFEHQLTKSEKDVLNSKDDNAKKNLKKVLLDKTRKVVSKTKSSEFKKLYESKKPKLNDGDVYDLIGVEFYDNESGIINCKVNGEHKQIRF
jgi:hypothetical protein